MKIVNILIVVIIVLLSFAAGTAKVMQIPEEMEFLLGAGLNTTLIILFGLLQIAGAVLLVPKRTRLLGAVLAAAAFFLSSVLIFIGGDLAFGLFSTLPLALSVVLIYQSARNT